MRNIPVIYRKVLRDLLRNFGRTVLVILSIAVGVMAVGMIVSSNTLLHQQMTRIQLATHPSHVRMYLNRPVEAATIRGIAALPGVAGAQGFTSGGIRWKVRAEDDWRDATLIAVPPPDAQQPDAQQPDAQQSDTQQFDLFTLQQGRWPGAQTIAVEGSQFALGVPPIGGTVYFEVNGQTRAYEVRGVLRDHGQTGPPFTSEPAFYVTPAVMARLTGLTAFTEIRFALPQFDPEDAGQVAERVKTKLERQGVGVGYTHIQPPEEHWAQEIVDGVGLILTVMAFASLFLSVVLVINTVNAIIAQQIPQIGIMKTVGGLRRQISPLYLAGVVVYGGMSLLLAVPLGTVAGHALSGWMLTFINVPRAAFGPVRQAVLIQIGAGLLVPVLAALWPVLHGVAISVREALSAYGLNEGYGMGFFDRALGLIRGLPRIPVMALRNTFRKPGRVALTQIVLTTAGAIFIMVLSTHFSFTRTLAEIWEGFGFDVWVRLAQDQRIEEVLPQVEAYPGVKRAEMWLWYTATTRTGEAVTEEYRVRLRGLPRDTQMYVPNLVAGRPLHPDDGHALLLNQKLALDMDLQLGDQIEIELGNGRTSNWTIVGLIFDLTGGQASGYMHIDTLNRELNQVGRASSLQLTAFNRSRPALLALNDDLRDYFESQGLDISYARTAAEDRQQAESQFNILTTVLMTMTVLMALVGSIGLSGTLSINVIERRREIGVMRAVGASSLDVALIFMGEGLLLGVLSWALAVPLSMLAGRPFVEAIGNIIDFPAQYQLAAAGIWSWLAIVVLLSLLASWLPARRATQISVNESLAYE